MNQSSLVFFLVSFLLTIAVIAGATDGDAIAATSNAQQQGRGRGAGLVERMRQRRQRREEEMVTNMHERRKGMSRAHTSGDAAGGMGRNKNGMVHKISGPLKKRLEEMRNRKRASEEL